MLLCAGIHHLTLIAEAGGKPEGQSCSGVGALVGVSVSLAFVSQVFGISLAFACTSGIVGGYSRALSWALVLVFFELVCDGII